MPRPRRVFLSLGHYNSRSMPDKSQKSRISCVIDGTNLFVTLRELNLPTRLHFTRLGIRIAKQLPKSVHPWVYQGTTYVTASPREADGAERFRRWRQFQEMVEKTDRVTLKLGRLEGPRGQTHEKGVDTHVTTSLLSGALTDLYDVAILISSDGDYAPAIDAVREAGKRVYVAFFKELRSYHLQQAANGFVDLTPFNFEHLRFYRYGAR